MRRLGAHCLVVAMKRGNARGAKGVGHQRWIGSTGVGSTGSGRNLIINGRRQPSHGGTSRMMREYHVRIWCSEASCHSSGWKPRQQRSPVAVVVISSNGEGNRSVGSLEVKAPGGRAYRSDPYRGASNLAGCSKCVNREAPKDVPRVKRIAGTLGVPSRSDLGEGHVGIGELDHNDDRTPRGHRERHAKKEWSVKARNHPRVASALPHSEGIAYKPLCGEIAMCSRVGRMGSIK